MSNSNDNNKNQINYTNHSSGSNNRSNDRTCGGGDKVKNTKNIFTDNITTYTIVSTIEVPHQGIQLSQHKKYIYDYFNKFHVHQLLIILVDNSNLQ